MAARHPKSRREIGEARVAQRCSTRVEFGGEEGRDTGHIVLYIISARQQKSLVLKQDRVASQLDIVYTTPLLGLAYRASTNWPGLVIVITGIPVYYLLRRSAAERRMPDGESP
jgi:hypothetical protein